MNDIVAKPLPGYLAKRYHGWKATEFEENRAWYARLADEGQRPRAMVISCCDSRVHVASIFGAVSGDFFIHRNIANLVPPFAPDDNLHGTSAALEYAVLHLKISNIIIVGHSSCGGVAGCFDLCEGTAPELENKGSFIGPWINLLRPGYEVVKAKGGDRAEQLQNLEQESVKVSLRNLMTFPFVQDAVASETLDLHGLWNNIGTGALESYDAVKDRFVPV